MAAPSWSRIHRCTWRWTATTTPRPSSSPNWARRSGCGLLVDVNNAYVSARNLGYDAGAYLDALPGEAIGEIHLAGHTADPELGEALLIDTHAAPIAEPVWALYARLIARIGPRPTLIERDEAIPAFDVLMAERDRADGLLRALTLETVDG